MSDGAEGPTFSVVPGTEVQRALDDCADTLVSIVEETYRRHGAGGTVNPASYFLRFPDRPRSRIIALPASLSGAGGTDGIKWISSFPGNLESGLPRASAVLVLNDQRTGYPYACLEGSVISAVRTAASAALAADVLSRTRRRPARIGFVGTGLIARYVHDHLLATGWRFDEVGVHDVVEEYAASFGAHVSKTGPGAHITVHGTAEELIRGSDLVVFATNAGTPHVAEPEWFAHHPLVLHVSLRDLAPEVVGAAWNVVDDVDHCLKENTSLHRTEVRTGGRDFVAGTLCDVLSGELAVPESETVVFSPFGLGVLDLAVGRFVYEQVSRAGRLRPIEGFFSELSRHG